MFSHAVPVMLIGLALAALFSIGSGRLYVRQTKAHRWAYGVRDGFIRYHFGTASTQRDAFRAVERWIRH